MTTRGDDMPTWKLLTLYGAWVVASGAIAVAVAGFVAVTADALGASGDAARVMFDVVAVPVFAAAVLLPFLLRNRTRR